MNTISKQELEEVLELHQKWLDHEPGGKCANLEGNILVGVDLCWRDLSYAKFRGANLSYSDFRESTLICTDLGRSSLICADFRYSDLRGADFGNADWTFANFREAIGANLVIAQTRILPEGDIIGWKKCQNDVLVRLLIPSSAKRSHAYGRVCRAEYAKVLEVIGADVGISMYDGKTKYKKGKTVRADKFDDNWKKEDSNGIHFFITCAEAENY